MNSVRYENSDLPALTSATGPGVGMEVTVSGLLGRLHKFRASLDWRALDVKRAIEEETDIPCSQQQLILDDQLLEDSWELEKHKAKSLHVQLIVARPREFANRHAILIGNQEYTKPLSSEPYDLCRLMGCHSDVDAMEDCLGRKGFTSQVLKECESSSLKEALLPLREKRMQKLIVFLYFAGHSYGGKLCFVDDHVALDSILSDLWRSTHPKSLICICLDACRHGHSGYFPQMPRRNVCIFFGCSCERFCTETSRTPYEITSPHGCFTEAFVRVMNNQNKLRLGTDFFAAVNGAVRQQTHTLQRPEVLSSCSFSLDCLDEFQDLESEAFSEDSCKVALPMELMPCLKPPFTLSDLSSPRSASETEAFCTLLMVVSFLPVSALNALLPVCCRWNLSLDCLRPVGQVFVLNEMHTTPSGASLWVPGDTSAAIRMMRKEFKVRDVLDMESKPPHRNFMSSVVELFPEDVHFEMPVVASLPIPRDLHLDSAALQFAVLHEGQKEWHFVPGGPFEYGCAHISMHHFCKLAVVDRDLPLDFQHRYRFEPWVSSHSYGLNSYDLKVLIIPIDCAHCRDRAADVDRAELQRDGFVRSSGALRLNCKDGDVLHMQVSGVELRHSISFNNGVCLRTLNGISLYYEDRDPVTLKIWKLEASGWLTNLIRGQDDSPEQMLIHIPHNGLIGPGLVFQANPYPPLGPDPPQVRGEMELGAAQTSEISHYARAFGDRNVNIVYGAACSDIGGRLAETLPRWIVFTGHGRPGELLMHDQFGSPITRIAPTEDVCKQFEDFIKSDSYRNSARKIDICLLNVCDGTEIARRLTTLGICCIAWEKGVKEGEAAMFSKAFFNTYKSDCLMCRSPGSNRMKRVFDETTAIFFRQDLRKQYRFEAPQFYPALPLSDSLPSVQSPSCSAASTSSSSAMPEVMQTIHATQSVEHVGVGMPGMFQRDECGQDFETERAMQRLWKFTRLASFLTPVDEERFQQSFAKTHESDDDYYSLSDEEVLPS